MRGISGGTADWISPMSTMYSSVSGAMTNTMNVSAQAQSLNDVGITVAGSKSTQSFTTTTMGLMETAKHNIVLKLLGETVDNQPVREAVTVKHKPKCTTCGKQNKATNKFCSECGTSLELYA